VPYQIAILPSAIRQLADLPRKDAERVRDHIGPPAVTPRPPGAVKMQGRESYWRIRVGDYRVIYQIRDRRLLVLVVRIGHRREVYR